MNGNDSAKTDVLVVGGGVIGLACAWRASRRGLRVRVLERGAPASGASAVAAGMLAPVGEASWGEERLLALNLVSHGLWPGFARELAAESSTELGLLGTGALHVALDRDEAEELRRRHELHRELDLPSRWLRGRDCRALEPGLSPNVAGGVHAEHESAVDPRQLCVALAAALRASGGTIETGAEVDQAELGGAGCELRVRDGRTFAAAAVVVATGAWSGSLGWLPADARPPVRPVKGEILTVRAEPQRPLCERIVAGERVYVVPRGDGRVVVGATVHERGFDTTVSAGGVHELLREAYRTLPEIAELELVETSAGLRPGTPDNAPVLGPGRVEGLILATGHYRNGILLAPVTGESVAALLAGTEPPVDLSGFAPGRFGGAGTEPVPDAKPGIEGVPAR